TDKIEKKAKKLANEIKKKYGINIQGKIHSNQVLSEESKKADILINATPLGMYPNIDKSPIPAEFLHEDLFVFDIVYNPLKTQLLKDASEIGCNILGGLDMLVNQGALSFEWWTNKKPNIKLMKNKIIEFLGRDK
ncbi:MAG: shikimate dehydrogenase family protein, partial [Promethearchaeota archaeon]